MSVYIWVSWYMHRYQWSVSSVSISTHIIYELKFTTHQTFSTYIGSEGATVVVWIFWLVLQHVCAKVVRTFRFLLDRTYVINICTCRVHMKNFVCLCHEEGLIISLYLFPADFSIINCQTADQVVPASRMEGRIQRLDARVRCSSPPGGRAQKSLLRGVFRIPTYLITMLGWECLPNRVTGARYTWGKKRVLFPRG